MLCPNCGRHFAGDRAFRSNIRGLDNVDIIYDITCPLCHVKIGKMFWGRLLLRDDLPTPIRRPLKANPMQAHIGVPIEPDSGPALHHSKNTPEKAENNPGYLPARRKSHDRRHHQVLFVGAERRIGERRLSGRQDAAPPETGRRKGDRRKAQRPVLFERRTPGRDRRKSDPKINRSI